MILNFQRSRTESQYRKIRNRSSQRVSVKKDVLRNLVKLTRKHLCKSLFFNKVADLRPAALFKKRPAQIFPHQFCEIFKNTFFKEHLWTDASEETVTIKESGDNK